jgi:hypothetical protein
VDEEWIRRSRMTVPDDRIVSDIVSELEKAWNARWSLRLTLDE